MVRGCGAEIVLHFEVAARLWNELVKGDHSYVGAMDNNSLHLTMVLLRFDVE